MNPEDNSLESGYETSENGLPSPSGQVSPEKGRGFNLLNFKLSHLAAFVTIGTAVLILLVGGADLIYNHTHKNKNSVYNSDNSSQTFKVGSTIAVQQANSSQLLQLGQVNELAVNGQLTVSKSLVLTPSAQPSTPVTGEVYYNQANNAPYYYNGTQFVSLAPSNPQAVTSLGGTAGIISLGNGLSISGGKLAIASSFIQSVDASLNTPEVNSLQGLTGNVTLSGGPGISISGTTISNTGVTGLTSSNNSINITNNGNGSYDLTLSSSSGSVALGPTTAQVDSSSNPSVFINKTGTGDLLDLQNNGVDAFVVNQSGQITTGTINYSQVQGTPATVVTDLSGESGSISVGSGLSITSNTLSNSGVVNIAGVNGAILLGSGLSIASNTLANSGVTSVTGTANQVIASSSTGSISLSLPQNIGTTSSPTFENETLGGNLTAAGALQSGNAGTAGSLILEDGSNHSVTFSSATQAGNLVLTIPDDTATGSDVVCLETLGNCTGSNGGSGDSSYIYNTTTEQTSANINIGSAAGSVAAKIQGSSGQNILNLYSSANDTTPVAYFDQNGDLVVASNDINGATITGGTLSGTADVTGGNISGSSLSPTNLTFSGSSGTVTTGSGDNLTIDTGGGATLGLGNTSASTINLGNSSSTTNVTGSSIALQGAVTASSSLAVTGLATLNGGTDTDTLNVSGTGTIGTLGVTNNATVGGNLTAAGALQSGNAGTAGSLILEDGSNHSVTFSSATQAGNLVLTIPDDTATGSDVVCLETLGNCTGSNGGSGDSSYIYNTTTEQTSANINIGSAAGSVAAKIQGSSGQNILNLYSSANDTTPVAYFDQNGDLVVASNDINGATITGGTLSGTADVTGGNISGSSLSPTNLTFSGSSGTVTTGSGDNLTIDTGGGATLGLGNTSASTINLGNSSSTTNVTGSSIALQGAVTASSSLAVTGLATLNGGTDTDTLNVSGTGTIGTLGVTNNATVGGNLTAAGALQSGNAGTAGSLILEDGSNHSVTFSSATQAGNLVLTIPDDTATGSDVVCLETLGNCTGSNGGSGDSSYIYNTTTEQTSANINIGSAAGSVAAKIQGSSGQNILNLYSSANDTTPVAYFDQNGDLVVASNDINGATITGGTLSGTADVTGGNISGSSLSPTNLTFSGSSGTVTTGSGDNLTIDTGGGATLGLGNTSASTINLGNSSSTTNVTGSSIALQGAVTASSSLAVTGLATLNGGTDTDTLNVSGTGTIGTLGVTNNATVGGNLTAAGALQSGNAGTAGSLILEDGSNHSVTFSSATQAGNLVLTIPDDTATGSDVVCLETLGNCGAPSNTVTTSSSGTAGTIPLFTGSDTIANSSITDNGTTVSVSETLSASTISTAIIQSTGTLNINPGGNLSVGASNHELSLIGNSSSTFAETASGHTDTLAFTAPTTTNNTITIPDATGTVCLDSSVSCDFALSGSGVTELDTIAGNLSINDTTGTGSVITIQNASYSEEGIAEFSSSDFQVSGGDVDTIQGISTTSDVEFDSLALDNGSTCAAGGNLCIGNNATVYSSNYSNPSATNNLSINGGSNNITFENDSGANTFQFPTSGGAGQVICTSGITCASGGGQAVILQPSAEQTDTGSSVGIYLNDNQSSGTANLVQLQTAGNNDFVIDNSGNTTISNTTTASILDVTGTLQTETITPIAALTVGSTSEKFSLQGTEASEILAQGSGNSTYLGFATPTGNTISSGTIYYALDNSAATNTSSTPYFICTTAGNCSGSGGSVTALSGSTSDYLPLFTGTGSSGGNLEDSILNQSGGNTINIGGNLNVGASGEGQLSVGVSSTVNGVIAVNNSTNANNITIEQAAAPSSDVTLDLPTSSGTFAVSASGPLELNATTGVLSCPTCDSSGGGGTSAVQSVNSLTGAITINNATTIGQNVQLNEAQADGSTLGIAAFNSTNFSSASGVINTAQNIATSSSPVFQNLDLQGTTGLTVGSTSNDGQVILLDGTSDAYTNTLSQATLTSDHNIIVPNSSGTLADSASGNLSLSALGNLTITSSPTFTTSVTTPLLESTGALSITPGGSLTVGSTSQAFTLEGSSASTITATSGSDTTSVDFDTPTTGNTIYVPDKGGTICLSTNNCDFATGGGSYINNTTTEQTSANINIGSAAGSVAAKIQGSSGQNILNLYSSANDTTPVAYFDQNGDLVVASNDINGATITGGTLSGTADVTGGNISGSSLSPTNLTFSGSSGTVTTGSGDNLTIDTGGGATLGLGNTSASTINLGNSSSTTNVTGSSIALQGAVTASTNLTVQGGLTVTSNASVGGTLSTGTVGSTEGNLTLNSSHSGGSFVLSPSTFQTNSTTIAIPTDTNTNDTLCLVTLANCSGSDAGSGDSSYIWNTTSVQPSSNFDISGNGLIGGTLGVTGNTTLGGTLGVTGLLTASGGLTVDNNASVGGTLSTGTVGSTEGNLTLNSSHSGGSFVLSPSTFQTNSTTIAIPTDTNTNDTLCLVTLANCSGSDAGSGDSSYIWNTTSVQPSSNFDISGNGLIGGTLGVTGLLTASGGLTVDNNASVGGTLSTGTVGSTEGNLTLNSSHSGGSFVLSPSTFQTNSTTIAIPTDTNTNDTLCLVTLANCSGSDAGSGDSSYIWNTTSVQPSSNFDISGNGLIGGTLGVTGNTTLGGTLGVTGLLTASGGLTVDNNASVGGTLSTGTVGSTEGNLTLNSSHSGGSFVLSPSTFQTNSTTIAIPTDTNTNDTLCLVTLANCSGSDAGSGDSSYIWNTTSVQPSSNFDISGNGLIGGTLGVTGLLTASGGLTVDNNASVGGTLSTGTVGSTEGNLTLNSSHSGGSFVLSPSTFQTNSTTIAIPTDTNTNDTLCLVTLANCSGSDAGSGDSSYIWNTTSVQPSSNFDISGNGLIGGTLGVTGLLTASGGLTVDNNASVGGTLSTGTVGSTEGNLTLNSSHSGGSFVLSPSTFQTNSTTIAIPTDTNTNDTLCLVTLANCSGSDAGSGDSSYIWNTTSVQPSSNFDISGNGLIGGTLGVTGNTTLGGTLGVTGLLTASGGLTVDNNASVGGTLSTGTVGSTEGNLTLNSSHSGGSFVLSPSTFQTNSTTIAIPTDTNTNDTLCLVTLANCSGSDAGSGDSSYIWNTTSVQPSSNFDISGNGLIGGTLGVTGLLTASGGLTVDNNASVGGTLSTGTVGSTEGNLTLNSSHSGGSFVLSPSTFQTNSTTIAIPTDTNTNDTLCLVTLANCSGSDAGSGDSSYIWNTTSVQPSSNFDISGNGLIGGTLGVTGNTTLGGTLGVTGLLTASGGLTVDNNASVGGTLSTGTVGSTEGNLTLNSSHSGGSFVLSPSTFQTNSTTIAIPTDTNTNDTLCLVTLANCSGSDAGSGDSSYIWNTTSVQPSSNFDISGNGLIGGTLGVTGLLTASGGLTVDNNASVGGTLSTGTVGSTEGNLTLNSSHSGGSFVLSPSTFQTNSTTIAIPTDTNTNDTLCLVTLANCSGSDAGSGDSSYIWNTTSVQPSSNFDISGNGLIGGTLGVTGLLTASGGLTVDNNASVGGTLSTGTVGSTEGNLTLNSSHSGGSFVLSPSTFQTNSTTIAIPTDTNTNDTLCLVTLANCSGSDAGSGDSSYIWNTTSVQPSSNFDISGNGLIGGTLGVTGNTTLGGTLGVTGLLTASGGLTVGNLGTASGQLYVSGTVPTYVGENTDSNLNIPESVYVSGNYAYVASYGNNKLVVYNISSGTPVYVGENADSNLNYPKSVYVSGNYAYVASAGNSKLVVYNISSGTPVYVSENADSNLSSPSSVYVSGNYAYVANEGNNKLVVYNISSGIPVYVGENTDSNLNLPESVYVSGNYAYVTSLSSNKLVVYNISSGTPVYVGKNSDSSLSGPSFVYVSGNYAYVASYGNNKLVVYNISSGTPVYVGENSDSSLDYPGSLYVSGNYAYVTSLSSNKLVVYNISSGTPVYVGENSDANLSGPNSVYVSGNYAYVASSVNNKLVSYSIGGTVTQSLQAGSTTVSTLQVSANAIVSGDTNIQGGLEVGTNANISGNLGLGGGATIQGSTILSGGTDALATPAAPTITPEGTAGSTSYSYTVTAVNAYGGETPASPAGSTSTGNATLSATNYNQITWSAVSGATAYKIYRTVGGSTQGLIGSTNAATFNDTGLTGSSTSSPIFNTTNQLNVSGSVLIDTPTNTTTAFQIQNASGTSILTADTTNNRIDIGTQGTAAGQLYVSGTVPTYVGQNSDSNLSNPESVYVSGNYAYVASLSNNKLVVYNISSGTPVYVGENSDSNLNGPLSVYVSGNYAYVASHSNNKLVVYNISSGTPVYVSQNADSNLSDPDSVYVSGNYAYVASYGNNKLVVYNISSGTPVYVGQNSDSNSNGPLSVYVSGNYAYVASFNNSKLVVYNISSGTPVYVSQNADSNLSDPYSVYVSGNYAYVASSGNNKLDVYNISSGTPVYVSQNSDSNISDPYSVYVSGNYAYVASFSTGKLDVYNISSGTPVYVGQNSDSNISAPTSVYVSGNYAYVATQGTSKLVSYSIGGTVTQSLQAGSTTVSTLQVSANAIVSGDESVQGGLAVGTNEEINDNLGVGGTLNVDTISGIGSSSISINSSINQSISSGSSTGTISLLGQTATNANTGPVSTTVNGDSITLIGTNNTNPGENILNGLSFNNVTAATNNTFNGLYFGSGYTNGIDFSTSTNITNYITSPDFTLSTTGLSNTGSATFEDSTNTTTAFQIQNASASSLLTADTSNMQIDIGGLAAPGTVTAMLAPTAVAVAPQGTTGGTSYSYEVTAVSTNGAETLAATAGSTTTGNATLSATNYNQVTWTAPSGTISYYKIYRTVGGSTTGLIGTSTSTSFNDTGYSAYGAAPALASSGSLSTSTAYYYEVTALDDTGGQSLPSTQVAQATSTSYNTITLSWATVPGARGYDVYRSTTSGNYTTDSYYTVYTNNFTDTGASSGTNFTGTNVAPPTSSSAYANNLTNNATATLTVGNLGTASGQLYVSGTVPTFVGENADSNLSNPQSVFVQGSYAYVIGTARLIVYNISSGTPVYVGKNSDSNISSPSSVYVSGNYAYVASEGNNKLDVYNISSGIPVYVGQNSDSSLSDPTSVYVSGNYAYVASTITNKLVVYNISSGTPVYVGENSDSNLSNPYSVYVSGNYAYVASYGNNKLVVYNISSGIPVFVGQNADSYLAQPQYVFVSGNYAYVDSYGNNKLVVYNISSGIPVFVGKNSDSNLNAPISVFVSGTYAYVTNLGGSYKLDVYNISSGTPVYVGQNADSNLNEPYSVYVSGNYAYVASYGNNKLVSYSIGGTVTQSLQAGSTTVSTLQVSANAIVSGDESIQGGLTVGTNANISGNLGLGGGATIQGSTILSGGTDALATPAAPTITPEGTAGSTSYSYTVTAVNAYGGETPASPAGSTSTGNATLSATNYNQITWSAVSGATAYKIYRTVGGSTQGLIGSTNAATFNDTGLSASGSSPTFNTTNQLNVSGSVLIYTPTNSTTAFQIQNASGTSLLTADTSNNRIDIGTQGTPTGQLYVSGQTPTSAVGSIVTGTSSRPSGIAVQGNYTYVANYGTGTFQVYDTSNPASPTLVGFTTVTGGDGIAIAGQYAYVVDFSGGLLYVVNISDPASPSVVTDVSTGNSPSYVYIQGRYAYVTNYGSATLQVFDIANPANPVSVGTAGTSTAPYDVFVSGNYAYVTCITGSLQIFNISNPSSIPAALSTTLTSSADANSIYVQGRYAYVVDTSTDQMQIFNISNPSSVPAAIGTFTTASDPNSIYVQGRYAYIAEDTNSIQTVDISNPAAPINDGTVGSGTGVTLGESSQLIVVQGLYAYMISDLSSNNLQIFNMGGAYTQQLQAGGVETGTLQVDNNANVSGSENIAGGLDVGSSAQIAGNFSVDGQANFTSSTNSTTAVQIQNSSGTSILTADTSNNRIDIGTQGTPSGQLYVSGTVPTYVGQNTDSNLNLPESVYVSGNYAYVASAGTNKLVVYNISSGTPVYVGENSDSTLKQPISVYVSGNYAYVASAATNKLVVYNISSGIPVYVGENSDANLNTPWSVYVSGNYAYVASYGNNKLVVYNISSGTPVYVGENADSNLDDPYSVYVSGNYAYVVNDIASGKLLIYNISSGTPVYVGENSDSSLDYPGSLYVSGNYAYVTSYNNNKLVEYNIASGTPVYVGENSDANLSGPNSVYVSGIYAYVASGGSNKLVVYNISSGIPVYVSKNSDSNLSDPVSVYVSGNYAYVASYSSSKLVSYSIGGTVTQSLQAGSTSVTTLQVAANAIVSGDENIQGGLAVGTNEAVNGNLGVAGTIQGSTINVGTANSVTGSLVVYNSSNSNTVTLSSGTTTASYTLYLPTAAPTATGECLSDPTSTSQLGYSNCVSGGDSAKIVLNAEYAGAVLDSASDSACSSANVGTLTSGFNSSSAPTQNYYQWTSAQTSSQCYDVVVQVPLPSDFGSFPTSGNSFQIYDTNSSGTNSTAVEVEALQCNGSADPDFGGAYVGISSGTSWAQTSVSASSDYFSNGSGTANYTSCGYMTLKLRLTASSSSTVKIGNIVIPYTTSATSN